MEQINQLRKPRGRQKGSKNKKPDPVELREALKQLGFDPILELVKMLSTPEADKVKANILLRLIGFIFPKKKSNDLPPPPPPKEDGIKYLPNGKLDMAQFKYLLEPRED